MQNSEGEKTMTFRKLGLAALCGFALLIGGCSSSQPESEEESMMKLDEYNSYWSSKNADSSTVSSENWSSIRIHTEISICGMKGIHFSFQKSSPAHSRIFSGCAGHFLVRPSRFQTKSPSHKKEQLFWLCCSFRGMSIVIGHKFFFIFFKSAIENCLADFFG